MDYRRIWPKYAICPPHIAFLLLMRKEEASPYISSEELMECFKLCKPTVDSAIAKFQVLTTKLSFFNSL